MGVNGIVTNFKESDANRWIGMYGGRDVGKVN